MKLHDLGLICVLSLGAAAPLQAQTFCNSAAITIPASGTVGVAAPYPSMLTVSGVPSPVALTLTINGLTHTFPSDIDMLLVGPFGQKMIVQSDTGSGTDLSHITYTLSDAGETALPGSGWLPGTYRPTSNGIAGTDVFAAPAPSGPYNEAPPTGTSSLRSSFGGINANGTWSLYVVDDANGDSGSIAQGWCLNFGDASLVLPLRISEFRLRGPSGANSAADEYVELMNISDKAMTVASFDGSSGYAVAASDGVTRCTLFDGFSIPAYGHFLCADSVGYSLSSYPSGDGTTATADATFTTDIPDNAGIALFAVSNPANFSLTNRLDAVGSTAEPDTLYKEGTGYPALTPFSIDYAFARDDCGKSGAVNSLNPCRYHGVPGDTDNNAVDFIFDDTNGTSAGAGQRLGAPGPQNLGSPTGGRTGIDSVPVDTCVYRDMAPNRLRVFTNDPPNNSTFGTIDFRRTYTNLTPNPLTRLRFRIVDLNTFPAASNYADLRARTSTDTVINVDQPPCGGGFTNITVHGTTVEQPPSQPNGAGFNGSFGVPSVTAATPLAVGASIDLHFLFGIQQTGMYRVDIVPEALPAGGGRDPNLIGCTDGSPPCGEFIFRDDFEF